MRVSNFISFLLLAVLMSFANFSQPKAQVVITLPDWPSPTENLCRCKKEDVMEVMQFR